MKLHIDSAMSSYFTCYSSEPCITLFDTSLQSSIPDDSFILTIKKMTGDTLLILGKKCLISCVKDFLRKKMDIKYELCEIKLISCFEEENTTPDATQLCLLQNIYSLQSHTIYLLISELSIYSITRNYTSSTSDELIFYGDLYSNDKYEQYDLSFHFIIDFRHIDPFDITECKLNDWCANSPHCYKVTDIVLDISHPHFLTIISNLLTFLSNKTYRHRVFHLFRSSTEEIPQNQQDILYYTHLFTPVKDYWKLYLHFYPKSLGNNDFISHRIN